jgi:hypothetical protein
MDRESKRPVSDRALHVKQGKIQTMLNLDLDNLPRALRAMKCQALAGELAKLRAEIACGPNDGERDRRKELDAAADAIEEEIAHAIGTPEQRALEAAEAQLEAGIREHLIHLSLLRLSPLNHREQSQVEGELEVLRRRVVALRPQASPYTSETEEKLTRVRAALTLPIVETARLVEIHKILGDA